MTAVHRGEGGGGSQSIRCVRNRLGLTGEHKDDPEKTVTALKRILSLTNMRADAMTQLPRSRTPSYIRGMHTHMLTHEHIHGDLL